MLSPHSEAAKLFAYRFSLVSQIHKNFSPPAYASTMKILFSHSNVACFSLTSASTHDA
jgi:hypothetical protein